jgi:hypothetical protein
VHILFSRFGLISVTLICFKVKGSSMLCQMYCQPFFKSQSIKIGKILWDLACKQKRGGGNCTLQVVLKRCVLIVHNVYCLFAVCFKLCGSDVLTYMA